MCLLHLLQESVAFCPNFFCLWQDRKVGIKCEDKLVGVVMYEQGCYIDVDPISLMKYINKVWKRKVSCSLSTTKTFHKLGYTTILWLKHITQILKSILNSTNEFFSGHHMDSLIDHLIREVILYYWYDIQCRAFGLIELQMRGQRCFHYHPSQCHTRLQHFHM